jgi:hypothetical protein
MDNMNHWLLESAKVIPDFIHSLSQPSKPGKFIPCVKGVTKIGKEASLGFSCLALKLYYILGLWEKTEKSQKNNWVDYINNFQRPSIGLGGQVFDNAFIDPVLIYNAYDYFHYPRQFLYHGSILIKDIKSLGSSKYFRQNLTNPIKVINAETKQAISTLMEIGAISNAPFMSFPQTREQLTSELTMLNWREPWAAGGQAAAFALFTATQPLETLSKNILIETFNTFFESIIDSESGTYFQGDTPGYGQAVNGAMKVLTALDWLQIPIHSPLQLIDTCLSQLPSPEGCHLVDTVYVLYRCHLCTDYRKTEVAAYLRTIMNMIKSHYNSDGGFSYYINRSQTNYYNIRISRGLPESDLHGTLLLTWAIAMILEIIEENQFSWRVLKP